MYDDKYVLNEKACHEHDVTENRKHVKINNAFMNILLGQYKKFVLLSTIFFTCAYWPLLENGPEPLLDLSSEGEWEKRRRRMLQLVDRR